MSQEETVGVDSTYHPTYLGADTQAYEEWCCTLAADSKFRRYELEPWGNFMKVGPKLEWYVCNEQGYRSKYSWGQTPRFLQAGYPMDEEPFVMNLANRIENEFGEKVNHAILKWYADGVEQSSPPHQDKADGVKGATADKCDMAREGSFYVFSFGYAREFTVQRGNGVPNAGKNEKSLDPSDVVWQKALASGSLLKISAEDNRTLYHALHKSKGAGERWSLIFRVIQTCIPVDPIVATEVNDAMYRFVSKAQVNAGYGAPTHTALQAFAKQQSSFTTAPQRKRAREA